MATKQIKYKRCINLSKKLQKRLESLRQYSVNYEIPFSTSLNIVNICHSSSAPFIFILLSTYSVIIISQRKAWAGGNILLEGHIYIPVMDQWHKSVSTLYARALLLFICKQFYITNTKIKSMMVHSINSTIKLHS